MLYNDPKVIFIHLPKTGGSSIEHLFARLPYLQQRDGKMGQHERLQTAADLYGDLSEYKIFAVMRNTYERIISLYCMYYTRGGRGFRRIRLPMNEFVSFPDYYRRLLEIYNNTGKRHHFAEDFNYFLGVDGKIPDNVEFIDFNDLEREFKALWCDKWGFEEYPEFPHNNVNKKVGTDSSLRKYLIQDPEYLETMEIIYKDELDYFNYEPIKYTRG